MTGPPPATAALRVAVRRALADLPATAPVAAAVSGGADSLALAAALAFERPGSLAFTVDHALQAGSAAVAGQAAQVCRELGLTAQVLAGPAPAGAQGPEGRARTLRYGLLEVAARDAGVVAVLLGHTLDDQAETVLLGLARGAGARSLSGMAPLRGLWRRPLLGIRRAQTEQACAEAGLQPWQDPHNTDPVYARVRVRTEVLPGLELALGPGVAEALARTAELLREDADALDALTTPTGEVAVLASLPGAVRARSLKAWAEQGCGRSVSAAQVGALRALVEEWHGQGAVALPGGVSALRIGGWLSLVAGAPSGATNLAPRDLADTA